MSKKYVSLYDDDGNIGIYLNDGKYQPVTIGGKILEFTPHEHDLAKDLLVLLNSISLLKRLCKLNEE